MKVHHHDIHRSMAKQFIRFFRARRFTQHNTPDLAFEKCTQSPAKEAVIINQQKS